MDFAFVLAFFVGLYTMHRLSLVVEGPSTQRSIVVRNLIAEMKRPIVSFTTIDGASELLNVPLNSLQRIRNPYQRGRDDLDDAE